MVDDLTDVLDFNSEGIDGMDDDAGEDSESMGYRIPASSHDIYMVDTPKKTTVTIRKIKPLGKNQSDGADAVPNPATVKISAKAPEEWILRSTLKAITTKWNQHGAGRTRSRRA